MSSATDPHPSMSGSVVAAASTLLAPLAALCRAIAKTAAEIAARTSPQATEPVTVNGAQDGALVAAARAAR